MPEFRNALLDLLNEPPDPVRVQFDDVKLAELAGDIRLRGVLQPLVVKAVPPEPQNGFKPPEDFTAEAWENAGGRYEVVAGHRRMMAARMAGLLHVPVRVYGPRETCGIGEMLAENFHREDVTAAEEGWKLAEYYETFKPSMAALCARVGQSESWVQERLDLVRRDGEVAEAVAKRQITFTVAKELLRVNEHTAALVLRCRAEDFAPELIDRFRKHRMMLLDLCKRNGASGRVAKMYVEQWKQGLIPPLAMPYGGDGSQEPVGTYTPPTEKCPVCDGTDTQNMLRIAIHPTCRQMLFKFCDSKGLVIYQ